MTLKINLNESHLNKLEKELFDYQEKNKKLSDTELFYKLWKDSISVPGESAKYTFLLEIIDKIKKSGEINLKGREALEFITFFDDLDEL